ncbi:MAG: hypothetical protein DMF81_05470, partial [Acidobacteria bacterium]
MRVQRAVGQPGMLLCLAGAVLLATGGAPQTIRERMRERRERRQAAKAAQADTGLVSRITTLKPGGARLDWIDGKIAFDMQGPDGNFGVYVMKPDGSDARCMTCGNPD